MKMGTLRQTILLAGALALLPVADANAGGDFRFPPAPQSITQVPSPIAVPEYTSWYLRADITWGYHEDPDLGQGSAGFSSSDMEDTWGLGGGLGYFFSDYVRGDVTLDYRFDTDVEGTNAATGDVHQTGVSNTVVLGNLYYDMRGRADFTPYVGVGAGFSYNETNDQVVYTNGVQTGVAGGKGNTDFALAAMAGFTYRMHDNVLFDAGYRYLHMGSAETDNRTGIDELHIDDMQAHEVRFGFRYEFQ